MNDTSVEARTEQYTQCAALLQAELDALGAIMAVQEAVRAAVRDKKWADYEALTLQIRRYGTEISQMEERRLALMGGAAERRGAGWFYTYAASFPAAESRLLCDMYRAMRQKAAAIGFANEALAGYLAGQRALSSRVLEAAFPDRRGTLYGRRGTAKNADMRGVVLNHTF